MTTLDESIIQGQTGHIADHMVLHDLNNSVGQPNGIAQLGTDGKLLPAQTATIPAVVNAVTDYGFLGDGTVADLVRFQAAVAAAIAAKKKLHIPAGAFTLNFTSANTSCLVNGPLVVEGAGIGQTTLTVGPNQPTFAYQLFRLVPTPAYFTIRDMTINGPADPTRAGVDWHDRNYETNLVYNVVGGADIRDGCIVAAERVKVGGKFMTAFYLSNGDVDTRFIDSDITAYGQCVAYFDGQTKYLSAAALGGVYTRSERWLRTRNTHFHDAGIVPWTAAEDGGGVADSTGFGHLIYPHPHVNFEIGVGTRFSGGVSGKYGLAIHTGSVQARPRFGLVDGALFEGPSGGLETGETGEIMVRNTVFDGTATGVLIQNDVNFVGCTFRNCGISHTGSLTRVVKEVAFRDCRVIVEPFTERFDAAMTSGTATLTIGKRDPWFSASLVGRTLVVFGAGAAGADLTAKVSAFVDNRTLTLDTAASTTVTAARYIAAEPRGRFTLAPYFKKASYKVIDCEMFSEAHASPFGDYGFSLQTVSTQPFREFIIKGLRARHIGGDLPTVSTTSGSPTVTFADGHGLSKLHIGHSLKAYNATTFVHVADGTIVDVPSTSTVTLSVNATATDSAAVAYLAGGGSNTFSFDLRAAGNVAVEDVEVDGGTSASSGQFMRISGSVSVGSVKLRNVTLRAKNAGDRHLRILSDADTVEGSDVRLVGGPNTVAPDVTNRQRITLGNRRNADLASAATLSLNTGADSYRVTGTTTINNIHVGSERIADASSTRMIAGRARLIATGAWTLAHNASGTGNIRTATGANVTVAAGDQVELTFDPVDAVVYARVL